MWKAIPFEEALAEAKGGERRLALELGASWCSMCSELERDVLSAPAGRALFGPLVTAKLDFDTSRGFVERYAIIEVPTVIVFDADGVEVGRVRGYADEHGWLAAAEAAICAEDPIPRLRAAYAEDPSTGVPLGEALLSREPDEGLAILERTAWREDESGAESLWVLGRYHHRVRRDPATARWIWQQLGARFGGSPFAAESWIWYAKAQAELGRVDLGSHALESRARAHPEDAEGAREWARFAGRHGYEPARAAIREALQNAARRARGENRDDIENLIMELSRPF